MTDILEQLLPASWRGIEFPVTKMRATIAHDLVEHKYWGKDGARVEATGLAPVRFSFTVPLIQGLTSGRVERWHILYPNQFRSLLTAFQKKATGVLQHPEFGEVACKAERMEVDWEATRRGGCDIELSFVETAVDGDQSFAEFPSPVNDVEDTSLGLDDEQFKADTTAILLAAGVELPPYLAEEQFGEPFSFGDAISKLKSVTDYPSLLSRRAGGRIDSIVYQADRLAESAAAARTALTWPVTQRVERTKAAAHDLNQKVLAGRRRVALFTVPADTTLAGVARQIQGASIGDLVKLNPGLMLRPEIPRGTVIRYYATEERAA